MNLPLKFARKYLLSKKLPSIVNWITLISIIGISLGTASLILVLSVFNGFYDLIHNLFDSFDPDIKIVRVDSQQFNPDSVLYKIKNIQNVAVTSKVLEGKAMLKYNDKQSIITFKGVQPNFDQVSELKTLIKEGKYSLVVKEKKSVILGMGVSYYTGANLNDLVNPMELYTISEQADLIQNPENALKKVMVFPSGVFSLQKEYDDKLVVGSYDIANEIFEANDKITNLEIKLKDNSKIVESKNEFTKALGPEFQVYTWYEQHETLYKVMQNEKAVAYLIVVLMLLIAACNIVGCLSMIVLEKKKDIAILMAMGASQKLIQSIFLMTGLFVTFIGLSSGMLIAGIFGWLQQTFGILKMNGGESFIVSHYPMSLSINDFILVGLTVLILGILASIYPAFKATQISVIKNLKEG